YEAATRAVGRARDRLRALPAAEAVAPLRRRLLPDRDVLRALARERLALPAAPAFAEAHPCQLRHQVELRRPDVAERNRPPLELPIRSRVVVRDQALVDDVVLVEAEVRLADGEGTDRPAERQTLQVGQPDLEHEAPARREVR